MKIEKLVLNFVFFILLISSVLAFTPQDDIDLLYEYAIFNATNVTARNFYGDGSGLTGITAISNASKGAIAPYIYDNGTAHGLNETVLNATIDARFTSSDTNCSVNQSCPSISYKSDLNYTSLDGNLTVSDGRVISLVYSGILSWLNTVYLTITDQRYNETGLIESVNTTANIESLNFTQGPHTVNTDTTYTAGENLTLTGTTFSIDTAFYTYLSNIYILQSEEGNLNGNHSDTATTWDGETSQTDLSVNDSDTLDGIDSTSFLRSDQEDTTTGNLNVDAEFNVTGTSYMNRVCLNVACDSFINDTCRVYPSGGQDCSG